MQRFRGNPGKLRAANIKAERLGRHKQPAATHTFVIDVNTRRILRPLLIALMAAALASSILVLAEIGTPGLRWYWLVPFVFVVALAASYSAAWLNNSLSRTVDRTLYRFSEVVVIVALARLVSWTLFTDVVPSIDELRVFLQQPSQFFLAGGFLTTALAALVAWWFAGGITTVFCQLDVSEEELRYYTLPAKAQKAIADDQPIQVARQELQDAYLRYFLGGGIILILVAALSTFEVREFATVNNPAAISRLGLAPAMFLILLTYFLVGIWHLSHARLLRLNARWLADGVAMDEGFERSWQRTSLLVLLAIAAVAAFIPVGNTFPISRFLTWIVNGIFYLISLIFALFTFLFGSMLSSMEGIDPPPPPGSPFSVMPPELARLAEPTPPNPMVSLILSSAFWAIMIAVVAAAALFVARERGYNLGWSRLKGWSGQFKVWLAATWAALLVGARRAGRALPARLQNIQFAPGNDDRPRLSPNRFVRLNGLSPREQIYYLYWSTVRRAGEQGVRRGASETPNEYAAELKQHWPDTESDVDALTSAFNQARYSPSDIAPETITNLKARWKELRARVRKTNRPAKESGSS